MATRAFFLISDHFPKGSMRIYGYPSVNPYYVLFVEESALQLCVYTLKRFTKSNRILAHTFMFARLPQVMTGMETIN